jgi:hypothetical protein
VNAGQSLELKAVEVLRYSVVLQLINRCVDIASATEPWSEFIILKRG